jgi:DNA-binding FadR family transcriptional regulator
VQRLLQTIRLGLIAPGEKLPAERELSAMLSVSRDTLREAIAALTEAGYVLSRRGRYGGTFVVDPVPRGTPTVGANGELRERREVPVAEIEDTIVLRSILELGAEVDVPARLAFAVANAALVEPERVEACGGPPGDQAGEWRIGGQCVIDRFARDALDHRDRST